MKPVTRRRIKYALLVLAEMLGFAVILAVALAVPMFLGLAFGVI